MTIVNGIGNRTLLTHTMRAFKQLIRASHGGGSAVSFVNSSNPTTGGGAHGVEGTDDFKVTAQGTPNMSVAVASGFALITQDANAHAGSGSIYNDASLNVTITTAHATLSRTDLICLQMRDNVEDSLTFNDWRVFAHPGTPGSGVPAPPLGCLVIAQVAVGAAVTSITNANITNTRPYMCALGGVQRVTSITRPTGAALWQGKHIYELDTNRRYFHNGSAWIEQQTMWTKQVVANFANVTGGSYNFDIGPLFGLSPITGSCIITVSAYLGFSGNNGTASWDMYTNNVTAPDSAGWISPGPPTAPSIIAGAWYPMGEKTLQLPLNAGAALTLNVRAFFSTSNLYGRFTATLIGSNAAPWTAP